MWFILLNLEGVHVFSSDLRDGAPTAGERLEVGLHTFEIRVPGQLLAAMTYQVSLGCVSSNREMIDVQPSCCEFTLRDLVSRRQDRPGFLSLILPWEHRPEPTQTPARAGHEPGPGSPRGGEPAE